MRYGTLRHEMANITDAILSLNLKQFIMDGIIERKQYDEIPPRVEYTMTEKGRSVVPILQSIVNGPGYITTKKSKIHFLAARNAITAPAANKTKA